MHHSLTRVLPYAPEQLFTLVGDVARYPEFVPWVTRMRVSNLCEEAPGIDVLDAEVSLSQVEKNLVEGRYDYLIAKAQLDRVMGRETYGDEKQ